MENKLGGEGRRRTEIMKRIVALWVGTLLVLGAFIFVGSIGQMASSAEAQTKGGVGNNPPPSTSPSPTRTNTPVPLPTGTAVCQPSWYTVENPSVGLGSNELDGVDASGSNDVWAVGFYLANSSAGTQYKRAHEPAPWQA